MASRKYSPKTNQTKRLLSQLLVTVATDEEKDPRTSSVRASENNRFNPRSSRETSEDHRLFELAI
jgi:hypothetical protein